AELPAGCLWRRRRRRGAPRGRRDRLGGCRQGGPFAITAPAEPQSRAGQGHGSRALAGGPASRGGPVSHGLDGRSDHLDGLVVEDLTVRFGGVLAVDGLSLRAPLGRVTGLIGPNGAGKSTTFGACSGFVRVASGRIRCCGRDVTHLPASHRAHAGIGRTFQRIELFDSLSVAENVAMGLEARLAGSSPLTVALSRRGQGSAVAAAAREALERCGLSEIARDRAGVLSTGQRRLVELARALAGGFRIPPLGEPSSGLDASEVVHFSDLLRRVVASAGL